MPLRHPDHDRLVRHVEEQGVRDPRVLHALGEVPRERFVPRSHAADAYVDAPLPIGEGQTISQPSLVAHMAELLEVRDGDRVLEIGAGSGYAAAVLARLAREVYAVERRAALAEAARRRLREEGFCVRLRVGDGSEGWPEHAPYDAILVSAAVPQVPPALRRQLAVGGRLVAPVGRRSQQRLVLVTRDAQGYAATDCGAVRFVPLLGAAGFAAARPQRPGGRRL